MEYIRLLWEGFSNDPEKAVFFALLIIAIFLFKDAREGMRFLIEVLHDEGLDMKTVSKKSPSKRIQNLLLKMFEEKENISSPKIPEKKDPEEKLPEEEEKNSEKKEKLSEEKLPEEEEKLSEEKDSEKKKPEKKKVEKRDENEKE